MADQAIPKVTAGQAAEAEPAVALRGVLWQPNIIVFVSSGSIMILELVAGRIIAPHVGSSLYTWTSVIGVVLAGISLGNYVGGRLADRWASLRLLGIIYLLAAAACLGVLWVDQVTRVTPRDWSIVAEVLALTTALFFLPCAILGTLSPIVAKLAVSDLAKTGSTVGKIYAAGALGSIVGTFITGFVLISWFGTYNIIWGVTALLAAMGLLFLVGARWQSLLLAILLIGGGSVLALNQGWLKGPCLRETNYYCIKINYEGEADNPIRLLVLDHLVHSYVDMKNPKALVYGYEKMYAEAAAYLANGHQDLSALMIGGGGYTFPRYIEAVYPNSTVDVVEIDPGVTQAAHDLLGLRQDTKIVTYNEDARLYLGRPPTKKYDMILGDAFNHFSVPYHLTTKEFNDQVRRWMKPDGLYVVNIIDGPYGEFLRSYYHTLTLTFPHVYLAEGSSSWRDTLRTTFVLIASDTPFDMEVLQTYDGGEYNTYLSRLFATPEEIERLLTEAPVYTLTDQFAPVDNMLASVFLEELRK